MSVPPYERMTIYDTPGTGLAQILEGEATLKSLMNLTVGRDRLSPEQRTDLAASLLGEQKNPYMEALIGVATNPFVWLMGATLAVRPVAHTVSRTAKAAGQGYRELFESNESMQRMILKAPQWLRSLLSPTQVIMGTAADPMAADMYRMVEEALGLAANGVGSRVGAAAALEQEIFKTIGKTHGIKAMARGEIIFQNRWQMAGISGNDAMVEVARSLQELDKLMAARAHGLVGETLIRVPSGKATFRNAAGEVIEETVGNVPFSGASKTRQLKENTLIEQKFQTDLEAGVPLDVAKERRDTRLFHLETPQSYIKEVPREGIISRDEYDTLVGAIAKDLGVDSRDLEKLYQFKQSEMKLASIRALGDEKAMGVQRIVERLEAGDFSVWDETKFVADRGKVERYIDTRLNLSDKAHKIEVDDFELQGDALIASVLHDIDGLKRTSMSKADIDHIQKVLEGGIDLQREFLPRISRSTPGRVEKGRVIYDSPDTIQMTQPEATLKDRLVPLSERETVYDYYDIQDLRDIANRRGIRVQGNDEALKKLRTNNPSEQRPKRGPGDPPEMVLRLDFFGTHERQLKNMAQVKTLYTDRSSLDMLIADFERTKRDVGPSDVKMRTSKYGEIDTNDTVLGRVAKFTDSDVLELKAAASEFSYSGQNTEAFVGFIRKRGVLGEEKLRGLRDAINSTSSLSLFTKATNNLERFASGSKRYLEHVVLPLAMNEAPLKARMSTAARLMATQKAYEVSEGKGTVGALIKIAGKLGYKEADEALVRIGELAKYDAAPGWAREGLPSALAKHLYRTHLGVNPASIVLNLMQPLTLLTSAADNPVQVAHGYGRAFKFTKAYAMRRGEWALRNKSIRISDAERRIIAQEALNDAYKGVDPDLIPSVEDLGISENMMSTLDFAFEGTKKTSWLDFTLKPFEKSEWFNRVVTADVIRQQAVSRGIPYRGTFNQSYRAKLKKAVETFQFGSTPMNTPEVFQAGNFLSNPLARQFLSFPLRTLTTAGITIPSMNVDSFIEGLGRSVAIGMGISAALHEATKPLGINIDRGLYFESVSSPFDPEQGLPTPPVVNIPFDFLQGITGGDFALVGRTAMRALVPGGVALSRPLKAGGRIPGGLGSLLQNEYVDWNGAIFDEERGTLYPILTRDNRLVEYRSKAEIMFRAMGLDLGSYQEQGGLDQYLLAQRENVVEARRQMLDALARNDSGKARRVASQFEKAYGFPLTATDGQVKSFVRGRTMGRTERILDRTDAQLRPLLAAQVKQAGFARNTDVTAAPTAAGRQRSGYDLEAEVAEMQRQLRAIGGGPTGPRPPFEAPSSY